MRNKEINKSVPNVQIIIAFDYNLVNTRIETNGICVPRAHSNVNHTWCKRNCGQYPNNVHAACNFGSENQLTGHHKCQCTIESGEVLKSYHLFKIKMNLNMQDLNSDLISILIYHFKIKHNHQYLSHHFNLQLNLLMREASRWRIFISYAEF